MKSNARVDSDPHVEVGANSAKYCQQMVYFSNTDGPRFRRSSKTASNVLDPSEQTQEFKILTFGSIFCFARVDSLGLRRFSSISTVPDTVLFQFLLSIVLFGYIEYFGSSHQPISKIFISYKGLSFSVVLHLTSKKLSRNFCYLLTHFKFYRLLPRLKAMS